VTIWYFLLRPKEDAAFAIWWRRGRWALFAIFINCAIAVVSVLSISGYLVASQWFYANGARAICQIAAEDGAAYDRYLRGIGWGIGSLVVVGVSTFILMI
jgi:hypothetical protein